MTASQTQTAVEKGLQRCGYSTDLLRKNYRVGAEHGDLTIPLAGFAHRPYDTRSACVAFLGAPEQVEASVAQCLPLGAPIVFIQRNGTLEWWVQAGQNPRLHDRIPVERIKNFFESKRKDFEPHRIYRAKTLGGVREDEQLDFVDAGLLPLVEGEAGERLSRLVSRGIEILHDASGRQKPTPESAKELFRYTFWLVAAKMLKDKGVPQFRSLNLNDCQDVFQKVAQHYGESGLLIPQTERLLRGLGTVAHDVAQFAHLGNVSTEALGYLYENTLITPALRKELAIHSTPPFLVDYIVLQLVPWIDKIPEADLRVFEPACGHGAFLVAMARHFRERFRDMDDVKRRRFLRQTLHGVDCDSFALEIARLSLTLSDIPNPNGWNLHHEDMFLSDILQKEAGKSTILLMNPPYARPSDEDKATYARNRVEMAYKKREQEVLHRTLMALPDGAIFGAVLPQGFLHDSQASKLRELMVRDFDLDEICLFPDKVFSFSDIETTVILGRKTRNRRHIHSSLRYRRVREADMGEFRRSYTWSSETIEEQQRFLHAPKLSMRVPELEVIWQECAHMARLSDIAEVGKGLDHIGETKLKRGVQVVADEFFEGAVPGFAKMSRDLMIHSLPKTKYLNLSSDVINASCLGTEEHTPQILVNYARVSRGPWRVKAMLDKRGHPFTSRFVAVRPKTREWHVRLLWGFLNSPIANAFMYTHCPKRDNLSTVLRKLPVPAIQDVAESRLLKLVEAYLTVVCPGNFGPREAEEASELLLALDAEVLRLYDLPPRLERQLLDLFAGHKRVGVPFDFHRYYPEDFRPCIPYHVYRSEEYARSTAGELRRRWEPVHSEAVLSALDAAANAFSEE